jgi:hypothetical protein
MKKIAYKRIFSLFLNAVNCKAEITSRANRLKAKQNNSYFTLYESTKKIVLQEYIVEYKNFEYQNIEKVYVYKIIEILGDINIIDEKGRVIICLTADHEILKIDSVAHKQNKTVKFESNAELLNYKESQKLNSYPALF